MIRASVSKETAKDYDLAWKPWCIFLHCFTETVPTVGGGDKWFLLGGCSFLIRQAMVCAFAQYLFDDIHLISDRVSAQISALKFCVLAKGGQVDGFYSPQLTAMRQGLRNQPLPEGWEPSSRLPTPLDMAMQVHQDLHQSRDMEDKATAVAWVMAYCLLLRPSEYLTHTKHDRHVLRASAVEFECSMPDETMQFIGAHRIVEEGITWEQVNIVRITFASAKNIRDRAGRVIWFTAHRPNNALELPKALFEWSLIANFTPDSYFYHG
jgi:hypothetical protein